MKEKLLSFVFLGVLLTLGYHLALNLIYSHLFPTSRQFQTFWYLPLIAVPGLLLLALAWWLGFYRKLDGADLAVTVILLAIVGLTVPASYSCGLGCF
jgi:hypothetical protein